MGDLTREADMLADAMRPESSEYRALRALAARVRELEAALRRIDKLDGRYADLNTARYFARNALAGVSE